MNDHKIFIRSATEPVEVVELGRIVTYQTRPTLCYQNVDYSILAYIPPITSCSQSNLDYSR